MHENRPAINRSVARRDYHVAGDDDKHAEGNLASSKEVPAVSEAAPLTKAKQPLNLRGRQNGKRLPAVRFKN
jgi:hypothetical protein